MEMTGILQRARSELPPSAKWTCILALPAAVAPYLAVERTLATVLAESLPKSIRGSGFGIVYAIAIAIFGGDDTASRHVVDSRYR
jgi:hypothetical protein